MLRFALVGGFNTALDFVLLFLLVYAAHLNTYLSNVISTGICLVISFFLNKKWTFRSDGDARGQFVAFLVVTLVGLWGVQNALIWMVSGVLADVFDDALVLLIAKGVATVGSLTWNYLLYSRLVFRNREARTP